MSTNRCAKARSSLECFFESIDEGLCTIEVLFDAGDRPMDVRILEANPAFERHTGLQGAAGRTALELIPGLERAWIEMYAGVALTGEPVRTQSRAEGLNRWFEIYAFPLGPPEKRRVGVVFNNITDRKEAEQALRDRKRQFGAVADLVPDLLWSNDPEGYTTWYNRRWLEYTGLTLEQAQGFGWLEVLHVEERESTLMRFLQAMETEEPLRGELRVRGADGGYRWFLMQARPVRDEAGNIVQWFGAATDIHDLRLAMEATRASLAEKEALLKEIHHRVNNNLHVITSLLNLQEQQVEDTRVLAQLEETRNRIQSIAMIHESLYRSGSLAAVDLAQYAQRLAEDLVRFCAVGDRVSLEISGDGLVLLPIERAVPCGLLLNELLSNALKHAYPVGRGGTIHVEVGKEKGQYTLEVSDNGIGLPAGMDTRQSKSLGLQLVHVLARQLGGSVSMTSDGGGTQVHIRFPRGAGPDEEEE